MPLGRTPLLVEAVPARRPEQSAGLGNARPGQWAGASRKPEQRRPTISLASSKSAVKPPSGLNDPVNTGSSSSASAILSPASSATVRRVAKMRIGSRSSISLPSSKSQSQSASRPGVSDSQTTEIANRGSAARGQRLRKLDPKFPTGVHKRVHNSSSAEAHKYLDQFHAQRNTPNPDTRVRGVHPDVPGIHHTDKGVRERAWKMQAQHDANRLGGTTLRKKPEPRVTVAVVQHKKTGKRETRTIGLGKKQGVISRLAHRTEVGRRRAAQKHVGPDYDVVHTVRSEDLIRSSLLAEGVPEPRRVPNVRSDADIQSKIARLTSSGSHKAAAALQAQLRARRSLRKTAAGLSGGQPLSNRKTQTDITSMTQRAARDTKQRRYRGKRTQILLTPQARGASTDVIPIPELARKDLDTPSEKAKTKRLPRQSAESSELSRAPLLVELVTSSGVFATGLRPGAPITSHPRDQRNLPISPRKGGAVTTRDVGHTANTGAWVPDKKKRDVKPPKSKIPKKVWDPITRELESQPSNTGGVLTITRSRPKLLGG